MKKLIFVLVSFVFFSLSFLLSSCQSSKFALWDIVRVMGEATLNELHEVDTFNLEKGKLEFDSKFPEAKVKKLVGEKKYQKLGKSAKYQVEYIKNPIDTLFELKIFIEKKEN